MPLFQDSDILYQDGEAEEQESLRQEEEMYEDKEIIWQWLMSNHLNNMKISNIALSEK